MMCSVGHGLWQLSLIFVLPLVLRVFPLGRSMLHSRNSVTSHAVDRVTIRHTWDHQCARTKSQFAQSQQSSVHRNFTRNR